MDVSTACGAEMIQDSDAENVLEEPHTTGTVASNNASAAEALLLEKNLPDLPEFDLESEEENTLAGLDSSIFDDRWRAQMEELSKLENDELYKEESGNGLLPDDWAVNDAKIRCQLRAVGLTDRVLAYQAGDERTILEQLLVQVGMEMSARQFLWHERRLEVRVHQLSALIPMTKRLRGTAQEDSRQRMDDASWVDSDRGSTASSVGYTAELQDVVDQIPLKGMRRRAVQGPGSLVISRGQRDAEEKTYWTARVIQLLKRVRAPLQETAESSTRPEDIYEVAVGAARGSTMKTYLQAIIPFQNYLSMTGEADWTDEMVHIIGFLRAAASKPCSPTYPKRFVQALRWIMRVGGWTGPELIAEHVLVQKAMDYWSEALFDQVHPLKQAPKLPWVLLASMELYVCNDSHPKHLRYKAYTIIFKSVATLRQDDIQHLKAKSLRILGQLYVGFLMKSKTTGAAKRVRQLPVAVHTQWTLTRTLWLENGIALSDELLSPDADYMLPRFDAAGQPMNEPCSYAESAGLARKLFVELRVPLFHKESGKWIEGDAPLLTTSLAGFWTEHSARPVIPTAAQTLGASKESRDCLGRWSPTGADDYARAYRAAAGELQLLVLRAVLEGDRRLDESEVLDRIMQLPEYGQATQQQAEGMRAWMNEAAIAFEQQIAASSTAGGAGDLPKGEAADPPGQVDLSKVSGGRTGKRKDKKLKFLIVYTRNRKSAKLHKVGGCEWARATLNDTQEFATVTDQMYDTRCKLCWTQKVDAGEPEAEDSSSSDLSTL